ncbi:MutS-related protein [Flavicella sediminum]|uniref:MutS-related protein n=1 Tax=Flavicella sediminum TaxID=2585141 RepID=UPI00111FF7D9|nr:DNA mismatch repair protein MutS [Flavicella sediminum]
MNKSPEVFYTTEKEKFQKELKLVVKSLQLVAALRFSIFSIAVFFIYYHTGNAELMIASGLVGVAVFSFFLKRHLKLKQEKNRLELLVQINALELQVLSGDFKELEAGEEFVNPKHAFSYDIDLFGIGSFFQYLNRTKTTAGKAKLVAVLTNNENFNIPKKQKALKELAKLASWRQEFAAMASMIKVEVLPKTILDWIGNYQSFLPKKAQVISRVFSGVSLLLIGFVSFGNLQFSFITIWFFIGLGISSIYFKNITKLSADASQAKSTFQQYYKLIAHIESQEFVADAITEKTKALQAEGLPSSQLVKIFSKALDALDQRNNLVVSIVGNGLFLMDIQNGSKVEKWINAYAKHVEIWFEIISYFDAQNSLANFVFNHADFVFPEIDESAIVLNAEKLGHPLIRKEKRIPSTCKIDAQNFLIITGANMAGKSTFLRTISLSIVMANSGLPVCASSFAYNPVKLITSMRTSDSLTDDSSYFFSELTRLKFIVDTLKKEHYFIVLDEILKGTNSTDKALGSKKFVEKLVKSNATGIIATHDLSLCEITETYEQISNYYFDAEIVNDELFFDYKLKKGICQNMNASFLLAKMEIV